LGVQLKFGDKKNIFNIITEILPDLLKDFPIEVLRVRPDICQELVNLLKKEDIDY